MSDPLRFRWGVLLVALATGACRLTMYDITTSERTARVPQTTQNSFTIDTGVIRLPAKLGKDKTVDSATLDMIATNFHPANPVTVDIAVADAEAINVFRPVASFDIAAGQTRELRIVQTGPGDGLVRATQTESINIRFESLSPAPGLGEIEFRFRVRVVAHKRTSGMGPGSLLFY